MIPQESVASYPSMHELLLMRWQVNARYLLCICYLSAKDSLDKQSSALKLAV